MEAKGLETNLLLHEEMAKRFGKSLSQVKDQIHTIELSFYQQPGYNETKDLNEWKNKMNNLINKKTVNSFPSKRDIQKQLQNKVDEESLLLSSGDNSNSPERLRYLKSLDKLNEMKQNKVYGVTRYFGEKPEGEILKILPNHIGSGKNNKLTRTLVRKSAHGTTQHITLPDTLGPGCYSNNDPSYLNTKLSHTYHAAFKSTERYRQHDPIYRNHRLKIKAKYETLRQMYVRKSPRSYSYDSNDDKCIDSHIIDLIKSKDSKDDNIDFDQSSDDDDDIDETILLTDNYLSMKSSIVKSPIKSSNNIKLPNKLKSKNTLDSSTFLTNSPTKLYDYTLGALDNQINKNNNKSINDTNKYHTQSLNDLLSDNELDENYINDCINDLLSNHHRRYRNRLRTHSNNSNNRNRVETTNTTSKATTSSLFNYKTTNPSGSFTNENLPNERILTPDYPPLTTNISDNIKQYYNYNHIYLSDYKKVYKKLPYISSTESIDQINLLGLLLTDKEISNSNANANAVSSDDTIEEATDINNDKLVIDKLYLYNYINNNSDKDIIRLSPIQQSKQMNEEFN